MKKNKLILFDWGNIVESHTTGYSCKKAWQEIFKICGYNGKDDIFRELPRFKLTSISNLDDFEKVYNEMKKTFSLTKDFNVFKNNYNKCFDSVEFYEDVKDYEISLKDKCYIGILSNLTLFDKERLDKQVDLSNYDYVFLSFELGVRKPDIEIYQKVQNKLPFSKKDILFIDDSLNNIESAKKFGWNTLHITGLELNKIKENCEKFLK